MQLSARSNLIFLVITLAIALSVFSLSTRTASAATISLSEATSTSNNASTTLAKVGNTISFQFNLDTGGHTATSTPVINILSMGSTTMIANGNYTSTSTATLWTYSTTSVSAWPEGNITFNIGFPSDTNASATSTFASVASTTFQHVRFDKTPPTVTSASVSSNNASTTLAKPGDVLTLTFSTSEAIQTPSEVIIYGNDATVLPNDSTRMTWTASSTVLSSNTSGLINFQITTPTDMAGNATSTNTGPASPGLFNTNLTGADVTAYETVPSLTINGSNPDSVYASNSNSYADAGATATDALSASVSVTTTGTVNLLNAGTQTITYSATDAAGNTNSVTRSVTVKVPGSGGVVVQGGGGGGSYTPPVSAPTAPGTGSASGIAALQAQLQMLLAQIAQLSGSSSFLHDLTVGSTGSDVKALQVYLNAHGYTVATSGPGSSGNETMRFGAATKAALIKLQIAAGITPASGYFGPKTRAYVAAH